ncbi:MAG: TonB-dependent receptor [Akkermansia sp.]
MIENNYAPLKGVTRAVLAIAMAGSCAFAQSEEAKTAPAEETVLPAMTVSANDGAAVALEDVGVSVTVLNVEDLKKEGIYTVSEALTEVPGVYVLPGGGMDQIGNVSNIVVRGQSSQDYITPTVDGMRLNSFEANITPNIVGHTSLHNLGTVELLRGSQAAVYGGGAIGGVLYLGTPEGKGEPSYEIFGEAGSFNSYTGSVTAQGQKDKLSYYVNYTYMTTSNDPDTLDGKGYTTPDAKESENSELSLRFDYKENDDNKTTVTYRRQDGEFNYVERHMDWYAWPSFPTETPNFYTSQSDLITLKHTSKINEKYTSSLMAGYYGTNDTFGEGSNQQLRNVQIDWDNNVKWNKTNTTKAGFTWNRSQYGSTYAAKSAILDNVYGFYANHNIKHADNWSSNLAARLDSSSQFDEQFTFRADSSYKLNNDNTRLFASIGSGYKAPAYVERLDGAIPGWYGSMAYGNPDISVEDSMSFDFGVEQNIAENHKISATYFWIQTNDKIQSTEIPNTYDTTYVNLPGHALSQGVELSMSGTIEENWNTRYKVAYTYTQPKMSDDDSQISATARQVWSADIMTSPTEKFTLGAGFISAQGRVSWDSSKLDSYYMLRMYANYDVSENVSLHLRLENLTNQKFVTTSIYGYDEGSPINSGAAIYGGCTIKF